jgi:bifunctional non-homologous end joining protein LigD
MGSPLLRLSDQAAGDGRALFADAERHGWEGLLVKRADSPYRAGRRSPEWRKFKIHKHDAFVVGGWTEPRGTRVGFGALVLGVPGPDGALVYVGDVGTGFTGAEIDRLWARLRALATDRCPFDVAPKTPTRAHWVRPELVAQIRYTELTDEGRLRHPAYLGLRDDKAPAEVTDPGGARAGSDTPAAAVAAAARRVPATRTSPPRAPQGPPTRATSGAARPPAKTPPAAPRRRRGRIVDPLAGWDADAAAIVAQIDDLERRRKNGKLTLPDGATLEITNPHKIFWPQGQRTKGDLLRYYTRIAPVLLPVLDNRPLVMKRLPNGVDGQSFYQHRAPEPVPPDVRIETLPDDDVPARLIGGSLKTLLYMAQLASISMDPFFSTVDALHTPDQVAIDLDPQPGATFDQILDVARWVHEVLDRVRVQGFPKTSGSEGLHIYIPLTPGTPYEAGMLFCQIVATMVATTHPTVATVERTVARRKDGTVYVDYLQNIEGKTLACAYSARGSAFAGVSTPLSWDEVHAGVRPQDFTIDTVVPRVRQAGDLWQALREHPGTDLLGALEKLR